MKAIDDLERTVTGGGPETLDANEIIPCIWQGGMAPHGDKLRRFGFKHLILSAKEHQPSAKNFRGMKVLYVPMDDHDQPLSLTEWNKILVSALWAAERAAVGKPVLISCMSGWNRSGIITACALRILTNCSPEAAIRQVQKRRLRALNNESFKWEIRENSDSMVMDRLPHLRLKKSI